MLVGNVGCELPDCMIGIACHVMIEVPMASHVTPPSTTVLPAVVGQVGCVVPEVPADDCTASYRKLDTAAGCSSDHTTRSHCESRVLVPFCDWSFTRTRAALAGAFAVTVIFL